jgi:hypothetical protein
MCLQLADVKPEQVDAVAVARPVPDSDFFAELRAQFPNSRVFVASPIVLFWHNWADDRKRTAPVPVAAAKPQPARKSSTKAVK